MNLATNFVDFAKNSSVHGTKYIVDSTTTLLERIFWILTIMVCVSCSAYLTVLFWSRYTSNPTRTTMETNAAPINTVPFPGITICNLNMVLETKMESFLGKLDAGNDELLITKGMISKMIIYEKIRNNSQTYNMTEFAIAEEVLAKNGYSDIKTILSFISQSCEEMIIKCSWNKKQVQCKDIFEETYTIRGRCCSFNYVTKDPFKRPLYTLYSGLSSGLKITLIPHVNSRNRAGVSVTIHKPKDFPNEDHSVMRALTLGRVSYMQIQGWKQRCSEEVKALHVSHRQCIYSNEKELDYFGDYTYSNCLSLCEASMMIKRCGCLPFYYDFINETAVCNHEHSTCLENISTDIFKECDCLAQCQDEFYKVTLTTVPLSKTAKMWTIQNFQQFNYTNNTILLNIFFTTNRQTIWLRDTITSGIYLISSFGGIYSLFLGCSIITVFEILYYFMGRFLLQNTQGANDITGQKKSVMVKIFTFQTIGTSEKMEQSQYNYSYPIVPYIN